MNSALLFQGLASADNSEDLEALAYIADFYQHEPQALSAVGMNIGPSNFVL